MRRRKVGAVAAVLLSLLVSQLPAATSLSAAVTRGPRPPFTADFFGLSESSDLVNMSDAKFDATMTQMASIGVHWLRVIVPWAQVQPHDATPSHEDWTLVDRLVHYATVLHMQVDAIVDNPPRWAGKSVTPVSGCSVQPPFDLPSYAAFAAEVAARYPTASVPAIELENAPNLPLVWKHPDPCPYAELMKEAYPAIKAANPSVTVLTGGFGAYSSTHHGVKGLAGDVFFAKLYQYGIKGNFDVLSFHPYSYPCTPSQSCPTRRPWYRLPSVHQTMVDHGDGDKQIWATEFGSPTNGNPGDGHVDEATESSIMLDAMQQWVQFPWAGPFFVFTYADTGTAANVKDNWFGLVSHDLKHKKVAWYTYRYEATGRGNPPTVSNGGSGS